MNAAGGEARRLTSGAWSLPTSFPPGPPASPLSWSADGRSIAFTRVPSPHSGDYDEAQIHLLDVAAGGVRALTGRAKFEGHAVFSPDESRIASGGRPRGPQRHQPDLRGARVGRGRRQRHRLDRSAYGAGVVDARRQIAGRRRQRRRPASRCGSSRSPARRGGWISGTSARPRPSGWTPMSARTARSRSSAARRPGRPTLLPRLGDGRPAPAHGSECAGRGAVARPHRDHPVAVRRLRAQRDAHVSARLSARAKISAGARHPRRTARRIAREFRRAGPALRRPRMGDLPAELPGQRSARARLPDGDRQRHGRRAGSRRDGGSRRGQEARVRGRVAHRRLRVVVRRVHDHVAARALSRLARRGVRRAGDRLARPVQPRRLQRQARRGVRRLALDEPGAHEGVVDQSPITYAHKIRTPRSS